MQVFIQVSLGILERYSFQQPLLQQVKKQLPEVLTLDIDSASDEMLVSQACRLVQEAEQPAIYFKVAVPNANFGAAFRLIEELIRENKPALVLTEGTHIRLANIINVRPHLQFVSLANPELILEQLTNYYNQA